MVGPVVTHHHPVCRCSPNLPTCADATSRLNPLLLDPDPGNERAPSPVQPRLTLSPRCHSVSQTNLAACNHVSLHCRRCCLVATGPRPSSLLLESLAANQNAITWVRGRRHYRTCALDPSVWVSVQLHLQSSACWLAEQGGGWWVVPSDLRWRANVPCQALLRCWHFQAES